MNASRAVQFLNRWAMRDIDAHQRRIVFLHEDIREQSRSRLARVMEDSLTR